MSDRLTASLTGLAAGLAALLAGAGCRGLPGGPQQPPVAPPPPLLVDTLLDGASVAACSNEQIATFELTTNGMQGLRVSDPTHEAIGSRHALWGGLLNYYWKPVNGRKATACGTFGEFSIYDGSSWVPPIGNDSADDEYDWNINIIPSPSFAHIIDDTKAIAGTTADWTTIRANGKDVLVVQGEITPDQSLYDNPWFPNIGHGHSTTNVVSPNICVYGPWVMDVHHGKKPEIHPA